MTTKNNQDLSPKKEMDFSTPYYEDNTRISNSAIGWFLTKGPTYLKGMLDGTEKGISGAWLERGTMIHMYIGQPEEFWKNYELTNITSPSSKQQKDFCEEYVKSTELIPDTKMLEAYRKVYNNKKTDTVALKECNEILETYSAYVKSLSEPSTKKSITGADLYMLQTIESNLRAHKKAFELLYTPEDTFECHNEFRINWAMGKDGPECKSLLDRLMIDHTNKKIIIVDLKTTADVYDFKHSVETYDYYRQVAFYLLATTWYFKNILDIVEEYDVELYIVAIQSNGNYEVRVFNMLNDQKLAEAATKIKKALLDIKWHIDNNKWKHTKEYYESNGVEEL